MLGRVLRCFFNERFYSIFQNYNGILVGVNAFLSFSYLFYLNHFPNESKSCFIFFAWEHDYDKNRISARYGCSNKNEQHEGM